MLNKIPKFKMPFITKEPVKQQLWLLAVIFILAMTVIISTETYLDYLTKNYEKQVNNQRTHCHIGRVIIRKLIEIEKDISKAVAVNDNRDIPILREQVTTSINTIESALNTLHNGGTFIDIMPANFIEKDEIKEQVNYKKDSSRQYIIELIDLTPKIVDIKELSTEFFNLKFSKQIPVSQADSNYNQQISILLKRLDTFLLRSRENATKIFAQSNDKISQLEKQKQQTLIFFKKLKLMIVIAVIAIGSALFVLIYKRIGKTIKQRRKAEQNVSRLKKQMDFILGATNTGIDIIDPDFNIKFINSEWAKIYGNPKGKKCYQYLMNKNEPCSGCGIIKAFETKETIISEEILIKENNRPVQVTTIPFQDEKGNWLAAEVKVDISDRKLIEEKNKKAVETLETILQGLPIGVVIVGKDKIVQRANNTALKMMGKTTNQIVGKICHHNMCPAQKNNCPVWDKKQSVDNSEKILLHANGKEIPVLKTALPIILEDQEVLLEAFVDISQRKKTEEELRKHRDHLEELVELRTEKIIQTNKLLQQEIEVRKHTEDALKKSNHIIKQANQQLQEFLYIASHDLREPVRKVNAFGKLLSNSLSNKLTLDDQENLDFIIDGANKMQQMVESLLEYSKVAGQEINYKNINLNKLITGLQKDEIAELIKNTNAIIHIPANLPDIHADLAQMKLLFENLITNSINFCHNKKPEIIITAKDIGNDKTKIEISDNGIGINPEFHDKIFSMFKRLHSNKTQPGAGAGLAICRKIIEKHQCQICVDSEEGKGSKFSFNIQKAQSAVIV